MSTSTSCFFPATTLISLEPHSLAPCQARRLGLREAAKGAACGSEWARQECVRAPRAEAGEGKATWAWAWAWVQGEGHMVVDINKDGTGGAWNFVFPTFGE